MSFNALVRQRHREHGYNPPRPMLRPSLGSGLVISWAGMRGIVTLAAALALPPAFPFRDLIVLTAAAVVLGTLVIQGLTLKLLLRKLGLRDDDPVGREEKVAQDRALQAGLAVFDNDRSAAAESVRRKLAAHLTYEIAEIGETDTGSTSDSALHRRALQAARQAVFDMRANDEIGDDAFHRVEEKLDWLEMASGGKGV
jgi:NhaP-type Na+/H+ or K+/H+ antiporter